MTDSKGYRKVLAVTMAVAGLVMQGLGASGTWLGTQDNVWVNSANWSGSTHPGNATGQTATFDGGGNGFTWLDLAGLSSVKNIGFISGSVAGYTLGVGGVNAQTLVMEASGLMTMDSAVTATQRVDAAIQMHTSTSWSQHNFKNDSLSYPLVLNGNIAGAPSGGTPSTKAISVDGDGDVVIGGNISAGGAIAAQLKKYGQGTLTLAGAGIFDVDSEYYGGKIRMAHPQAYTGSG
ncbi:MAG: hypothetical protein PHU80_06725, partial [Kiritimatiellae bacterium]|nr:hypothetical protein [Kiritimatiellia bacterium]